MFVLQESCKLKFHLARILQDEVYLARILQDEAYLVRILQDEVYLNLARNLSEKCIVLQDNLQDLYFFFN